MSVVEQRYRAVLQVQAGVPVTEVAAQFGVSRQSVHTWLNRYREAGLGGLVDRSRRPVSSPDQMPARVEVVVCELRREHPRWGPVRIAYELGRLGVEPAPSRMGVYRALVRHGLIEPGRRRRKRQEYRRWERDAPMALWQMDIVGGLLLADGSECKVVTGVDDHSRFCVIAAVVPRASGRAVCLAFAAALRAFGVPDEVLTDNGKQFTDRFGKGGEVLFDRICRDNGITHRLTQPRSPTTTGKIERFHGTLRREFLNDAMPFADLAAAQTALSAWVVEYNTIRPHQALQMAVPADRFARRCEEERDLLPLRLPSVVRLAAVPDPDPYPDPEPEPGRLGEPAGEGVSESGPGWRWDGEAIEFERVVPPSGNVWVSGRQFWLGTGLTGVSVTFWADSQVVHLLKAGVRIKTVRSHFSTADLAVLAARGARKAGPPPLPAVEEGGSAIEVERTVNRCGLVGLGGRMVLAAEILNGRRVGIRIEGGTLMFFDPDTRQLLRSRPNPLTYDQARKLRGARPAGPPPHTCTAAITVQRRVSDNGRIMIAGQVLCLGRLHAQTVVTAHVTDTVITVELGDDRRTFRRTTDQPVRSIKAHRPRKAAL
ncbi:IS481 family transposase [Nonomuraea typhae]|uniref:IS481 family transposase n=1 Tax=Nonomuraea typhae TaxID=2603600 RepID=A0ABW7Z898_9ACTN